MQCHIKALIDLEFLMAKGKVSAKEVINRKFIQKNAKAILD